MKLSKQDGGDLRSAPLQSLAQGSMFWRPDHVEQSPWLDHLPLMFWLMEAMAPKRCVTLGVGPGSPHLAFCQGVQRLGLDSECLLIAADQDEMAGELHARADRRYGALAGRINVSPRRGAKQLEEGSIDILALDIPPDDEDMEDVLERWLPRVSERGVILIPGINRREPGCIAHQNFLALQNIYRSITFHHGDGLGVLIVGEKPPALLETLMSRWNSPTAARTVREVFARLGRASVDQAMADTQKARLHSVKERLETVEQERLERVALLAQLQTQLKERDDYLEELEADKLHLAEENADTQRKIQGLQSELAQVRMELSDKDSAYQEVEQQRRVLETTVAERDSLIAEKEASIQTRFRELATMTNIAEEADRQTQVFKNKADLFNERNEAKKPELKALRKQLRKLDSEKAAWQSEKSELLAQAQTTESLQIEYEQALVKMAELEALVSYRDADLQQAEESLRETNARRGEVVSQLEERLASLKADKKVSDRSVAELEALVGYRDAELQQVEESLRETKQAEESLRETNARRGEVVSQLEERLASLKADKKDSDRSVAELKKLLKKREKSLASRFDELGSLTAAMEEKDKELTLLKGGADGRARQGQATTKPGSSAGLLHFPTFRGKSERRKDLERKRRKQQESLAELEASEWFDSQWYLKQYPDIASDDRYSSNPALHYLKFGGFEGRDPSPHFDSAGYLEAYPDVAFTEINPLLHFIRDGIGEGRSPRP
ncbi:hypothetical protein ACUN9V_04165 [Salinicola sp. V024]|uniref:hypothetical protein n=1 Tax=Salinicola sp. V024 TaxID=3459609 RepID=UPI004044ED03